jgi:pimeloyl-ACP methyl ester carboxylesterase
MTQGARVHVPEQGLGTVDANGLRFAFLEWGKTTDPLALLLHGFPDTAHTWDELGPVIAAAGFRVVAPFSRGYAPTSLPPRDADVETLGADVVALIAALGAEHAVVIGHDWGADAAHAAAALAPTRVRRLVTVAIPHRGPLTPTPVLLWKLRHVFALSAPGAERRFRANDFADVDKLVRRWSPAWRFQASDVEHTKNAFAAPGCLHAALGYYRAAKVRLPAVLRKTIDVPSLVICGRNDPGAPVALFEQAKRQFTAGCTVTAIGGGHFCHRESPREFADAVLPFLRASDGRRA